MSDEQPGHVLIDPFRFKLTSIASSLSSHSHRLSFLVMATVSLGIDRAKVEGEGKTLIDLYDALHNKFNKRAPSIMYIMLEKCGCSKELLNELEHHPDPNETLEFPAALVLLVGSIFERIEHGGKFEKFIKRRSTVKAFKSYEQQDIDTPEKLLKILFYDDDRLCTDEDIVKDLVNWLNCHISFAKYINEINQLYSQTYGRPKFPKPPSLLSRYKCQIISLKLVGLFLLAVLTLSVFLYYYINPPVTNDMPPTVLYASPGVGVTSLIQCFDSKTKSIQVNRTEGSNSDFTIETFIIKKNYLNSTAEVILPPRVIFASTVDQLPSFSSVRPLNYFNNSNAIFTTTNGVITFNIELIIDPARLNGNCPFRILAYNDYEEYHRALSQNDSSIHTLPPVTECLNTTNNYSISYNLEGNSYYFFAIALLVQLQYTVSASANLTQYSTDNYIRTCSITSVQTDCSLNIADFHQALQIVDEDHHCLVTRFTVPHQDNNMRSFTSCSALHISLTSHAESVYCVISLFAVSGFFIAILVLVIVCVCVRFLPKFKVV